MDEISKTASDAEKSDVATGELATLQLVARVRELKEAVEKSEALVRQIKADRRRAAFSLVCNDKPTV